MALQTRECGRNRKDEKQSICCVFYFEEEKRQALEIFNANDVLFKIQTTSWFHLVQLNQQRR